MTPSVPMRMWITGVLMNKHLGNMQMRREPAVHHKSCAIHTPVNMRTLLGHHMASVSGQHVRL